MKKTAIRLFEFILNFHRKVFVFLYNYFSDNRIKLLLGFMTLCIVGFLPTKFFQDGFLIEPIKYSFYFVITVLFGAFFYYFGFRMIFRVYLFLLGVRNPREWRKGDE